MPEAKATASTNENCRMFDQIVQLLRSDHESKQRTLHMGIKQFKKDSRRRVERMAKDIITKNDNSCDRFANNMSRNMTTGLMTTYNKLAYMMMEKEESELARYESEAIKTEVQRNILSSIADVLLSTAQTLVNARLEDKRDEKAEILAQTILNMWDHFMYD